MGLFSEGVEVACTPAGQPTALTWAGRHYSVCATPVHWFERRQWWVEETRAPLGTGPGLVDHEIWRVQVRLTSAKKTPQQDETLTLDLTRNIGSGRWRLLKIHDALRPQSA
jgi:hypothetical protein